MPEITRREVYNIKPFRHITIGDPWYLENPEYANRNDLVFDESPRCCNTGAVVVEEVFYKDEDDNHDWDITSIHGSIILAKDEHQLDIYLQDKRYKNSVKKEMELGCDTAQFFINVVDKKGEAREMEFDTGADGFFGYAVKYKEYYGMRIDFEIDADVTTFEEVRGNLFYLFKFDPVKNRINAESEPEQDEERDL